MSIICPAQCIMSCLLCTLCCCQLRKAEHSGTYSVMFKTFSTIFVHKLLSFFNRQQLSKINFESPPISPKAPAAAVRSKTLREKSLKSSSAVLSQFFIKKPKESKQDAAATPFIKEEPMDVEEPSVQHLMPVKQEDTPLQIGCLGEETAHCSSPSEDVKPVIQGLGFSFLRCISFLL